MLRWTALLLSLPLLAAPAPTHRVLYDFALLHEGPGYAADVTGELSAGEEVRVVEVQGEWARVAGRGWVLLGFLEALGGEKGGKGEAAPPGPPAPGSATPPQATAPSPPAAASEPTSGERAAAAGVPCAPALEAQRARLEQDCRAAVARAQAEATRQAPEEEEKEGCPALEAALEQARAESAGLRERIEEERKIAREEGRSQGADEARREAEEKGAASRSDCEARLRAAGEEAERQREEAVQAARKEEHGRIETFLKEMQDLRKVQASREQERVESEQETMHEASLRKLRLQLERERDDALAEQERRLQREHESALLKATADAQEAFQKRLEAMRKEERERYQTSLEGLRAALGGTTGDTEGAKEAEVRKEGPTCAEVRSEERRRCDEALASQRSRMEADRDRTVQREVRLALRDRRGGDATGPEPATAASIPPLPRPVPARGCDEAVERALERARAEWQAETARYVERAVEHAREKWDAER